MQFLWKINIFLTKTDPPYYTKLNEKIPCKRLDITEAAN